MDTRNEVGRKENRTLTEKLVTFLWRHRHLLGMIIACVIAYPTYYALDRKPPWVRLDGHIDPTPAGGQLTVHWKTTPFQRACPGFLQIELISRNLIRPVFRRPVNESIHIGQTEYTPASWPVFRDIPPGPAIYRVTSYWYCNWFQVWFDWPVYQVGPDIPFQILPFVPPTPSLPGPPPP